MDTSDAFSRIWTAFDVGETLPACAWCGRVRIDETWLLPSPAALAAVDERYTFSHSICDECADTLRRAGTRKRSAASYQFTDSTTGRALKERANHTEHQAQRRSRDASGI